MTITWHTRWSTRLSRDIQDILHVY